MATQPNTVNGCIYGGNKATERTEFCNAETRWPPQGRLPNWLRVSASEGRGALLGHLSTEVGQVGTADSIVSTAVKCMLKLEGGIYGSLRLLDEPDPTHIQFIALKRTKDKVQESLRVDICTENALSGS